MLVSNNLVPAAAPDSTAGIAAAESTVLGWLSALRQHVQDCDTNEGENASAHHGVLDALLHTLSPRGSNKNCSCCQYKVQVLLRNGGKAITTALLHSCQYKSNHNAQYFEKTLRILYLLLHQATGDERMASFWTPQDMEIASTMLDAGFVECFHWYIRKGGEKSHSACRVCIRLVDSIFSAIYFGCGGICFQCLPNVIHHQSLQEFAKAMLSGFIHLMTEYGLKETSDMKQEAEASKTFQEGLKTLKWFFLSGSVDFEAAAATALSTSLVDVFEHKFGDETSTTPTHELFQMLLRGIAHHAFDLEMQDSCLSFLKGMIGKDMAKEYMQGIEAQYHVQHWKCSPAA